MVRLEMYGRSEPGFKDVFLQAACDAISMAVGVGAGREDEGPRLRRALARGGVERKKGEEMWGEWSPVDRFGSLYRDRPGAITVLPLVDPQFAARSRPRHAEGNPTALDSRDLAEFTQR